MQHMYCNQLVENNLPSAVQNFTFDKDRFDQLNAIIVQEITNHYHDKLGKLYDEYIVTAAGKFLSAPLHNEMAKLLQSWQQCAPALVNFY